MVELLSNSMCVCVRCALQELMFKYSWNNFLHTQVEQCLCTILQNHPCCGDGAEDSGGGGGQEVKDGDDDDAPGSGEGPEAQAENKHSTSPLLNQVGLYRRWEGATG